MLTATSNNKKRNNRRNRSIRRPNVDQVQNQQIRQLSRVVSTLARTTEIKYVLQSNQLFANMTSTPQTLLLNGLSRGDTVQSRTGDVVLNKRISIRGHLTCGMAATPYSSAVRFVIVCVKPSNYATTLPLAASSPASGYLFNNSTPYVNQMYNFNNTDIKGKFTILYDQVHCLVQTATAIPFYKVLNLEINLNTKTSYRGGNVGTGADIDQNQYWIAAWTDNTTAGANYRFDSAFYFLDN